MRCAGSSSSACSETLASAAVPIGPWGKRLLGWRSVSAIRATAVLLQRLNFLAAILTEGGERIAWIYFYDVLTLPEGSSLTPTNPHKQDNARDR